MNVHIRPIQFDPEAFAAILAEAPQADGAFMLRVRDEWLSGDVRFDGPGEILLGIHIGGSLAGVGGVTIDPYSPEPGLGRVRHLYVVKQCRGRGVGRLLMEAILAHARMHFRKLRPRTHNPRAARLYERIGFTRVDAPEETHRLVFEEP